MKHSTLRAVLAAAALLLMTAPIPNATAQAAGEGAIYLTAEVVTAADTGTKVFAATDAAPTGEEAGKAYLATSFFALTYTTQWDYEVTSDFALEGMVKAVFYVACDSPAAYRPGAAGAAAGARFILMKDGDAISQQDAFGVANPCTGSSSVRELAFEVDSAGTEFEAGDVLNIQFLLWVSNAPESVRPHVYVLTESTAYPSGITGVGLPGGGDAAPAVVQEDLAGETADVSHAFDTATTATYQYNWTANLTEARIVGNASASNGTAQVTVRDGDGSELVNTTVTTDGWNETIDVEAAAGNWTIEIAYVEFIGSLDLAIGAVPEAPPITDGDGNETAPDGNETADPESAEDAGLPGPGLVAVLLVALGAAVALRRRR